MGGRPSCGVSHPAVRLLGKGGSVSDSLLMDSVVSRAAPGFTGDC